jgi:multiple sugar transport system ATP-binding protein
VQTRAEIVALHRRVGAATVYVTHDQSEAMTMSDRVAVMMGGEILQIASPEEIYLNPADIRVASFIGSPKINAFPAEADDKGAVAVDGLMIGLISPARGPMAFRRASHIWSFWAIARCCMPRRLRTRAR